MELAKQKSGGGIPWPSSMSSQTSLRSIEEIRRYNNAYRTSGLCITAASAIVEEMLRSSLKYHSRNKEIKHEKKVPFYLNRIVAECVASILQIGYFAYRIVKVRLSHHRHSRKRKRHRDRHDEEYSDGNEHDDDNPNGEDGDNSHHSTSSSSSKTKGKKKKKTKDTEGNDGDEFTERIIIAPVGATYPIYDENDGAAVKCAPMFYEDTSTEWTPVFFRMPVFSVDPSIPIIQSAVADAYDKILRFTAMSRNFSQKDNTNTYHTLYTTVDRDVGNVGGGIDTYFSTRSQDADAIFAAQLERHGDINMATDRRTEFIKNMSHGSTLARAHAEANPGGVDPVTGDISAPKRHVENIVTDGCAYTEGRPLQSLSNASHMYDRLKTTIMFCLGVPPQAVGENINSERLASSAGLTQAALRMFAGTVGRFKEVIGDLFSEIHDSDGFTLKFTHCFTQYDLMELLPVLDKKRTPDLFACAYDVPKEWFPVEEIRKYVDSQTPEQNPHDKQKVASAMTAKRKKKANTSIGAQAYSESASASATHA